MFKIIQKAPINQEAEKCFSLLIMNNFYENILSSNYIESELLALIERSLNYEINNLNSKNDYQKFLNPSATGFLLGGLISKNDVKSYFQMILKGIFEKMENKNKNWDFAVQSIAEYVSKKKSIMMKEKNKNLQKKNSSNQYDNSFDYSGRSKKEKEEEDNFFLGTYTPDLRIKDLIAKKEHLNEDMKDYIQKQIDEGKNDENIYSTSFFLSQVYSSSDDAGEVLSYYQKDFMNCIEIIKEIFNLLNQNMHLVPFSIKCVCRIISILVKRKFKDISKVELNAFIGQFFFQKLFSPICRKPDYNALITSFIISKQTRQNINYTCSIINQLISGKFFNAEKAASYTPFNWFFILDSMPMALEFFDKIINVTLPPYIEKIIDNNNDDNYYYNFFEENKDEFAFQKSICFSLQDFNCLFNIAKENKDFFIAEPNVKGLSEEIAKKKKNERRLFGLTIDKLSMKVHNDKIKNHLEKEKSEKIINFFLKSDTSYNKKFSELLNIKQKKSSPSFNIPELKELSSEEDIQKNNLIKIQNCLSTLLFNYRILNKSDFSEGTSEDTINILNEILKFLKTGSFVLDNTIPTDWYVHTLIKLLKNVPEEYKKNDFELIYENLTKELNESIKSLDFAELSRIFERLKYTERAFKNINKNLLAINEIETNNIIKNFVENHKLEVEIKFNFTNRKFEIQRCNYGNNEPILNEFLLEESLTKSKKKPNVFKTIFEFANKFPPLVYYQQKQGYELFELEEEFKLPEQLEIYFKFVKEEMKKNKLFHHLKDDPRGFQLIYHNITSYIMDKLYDKIFPVEPDIDDICIYQNSVRLAWIEPGNLIKNNNYNFDNFLPETKELILKLDSEKAPLKKIRCLTEVDNRISNIIAFNNGGDFVGVDDTLPIFQFAVIKAQPNKFSSNYKYMNMFLNKELRSGPHDHLISQMNVIGEFIKTITYDKLNDVTKEMFVRKCEEATNQDLSH